MLILTMPSPLIRCQPRRNFLVTAFLLAASHTIPIDSPAQKPALAQPAVANYLNTQPGVEYVSDQVCGSCHSFEYKTFKQTAIGRSTSVPSEQDLKSLSKPVTFSNTALNRTYSVYAQDGKMFHQESERDASGQLVFSDSHEIAYVVGAGEIGKSELNSPMRRLALRSFVDE